MTTTVINQPFVKSPFISKIIGLFDTLRYQKANFGAASCALITGESGSGKSELAKFYLRNNPVVEEEERTHIPVLHFELKAISTPVEFLRSLLIAIGDPQQARGARNAGELFDRLVVLIRTTGIELLIFDEIQVIIERRSERVITGLADLFKDLIKETNVPIVFMGMPWSRYLVDSNAQLKGRISYRYTIAPYRIGDRHHRDDYRRLLKSLADAYGMPDTLKLESLELTLRFFSFTSGNLRATANLVRDACMLSTMRQTKIDVSVFSDVVKAYGVSDGINPFLIPVNKLELRELIIHSDWQFGTRTNANAMVEAEYASYGVTAENKIYSLSGTA